jgi:hypothetical protein
MKIRIVNKGSRNQLVCERKNGTFEIADLGPNLPFHDIAHFVVERQLRLRKGFYGNIYDGYSIKQLSDKEVIKTLHVESAVSEIITRALQSLSTGACTIDQFSNLINEEFQLFSIRFSLNLGKGIISEMLADYKNTMIRWEQLENGETLDLNLEIEI